MLISSSNPYDRQHYNFPINPIDSALDADDKNYSYSSMEESSDSFSEETDQPVAPSQPTSSNQLTNTPILIAPAPILITPTPIAPTNQPSPTLSQPSVKLNYATLNDHPSLKDTRTIKQADQNLAPSTMQEDETDIDELIKNHSYMRVLLIYLRFIAIEKLGTRSDGTLSDVKVTIKHANTQYGQGSNAKETNACHPCAVAGTTDNLRKIYQKQIFQEHQVTPLKERILLAKTFPQEALALLKDPSSDETLIKNIFATHWPQVYVNESVLSNTDLDSTLNATNELPRKLNLLCDKLLEEKIRVEAPRIIEDVMHGKLTAEEGTEEYYRSIIDHFTKVISALNENINEIQKYKANLRLLKKEASKTSMPNLSLILKKMASCQKRLQKGDHSVSKTALKKNNDFLEVGFNKLNHVKSMTSTKFSNWVNSRYVTLKIEINTKLKELEKMLSYNTLEKDGTILPPFEFYSGNYSPTTQRIRPFTARQKDERQLDMLEGKPVKQTLFKNSKNSVAKKPSNTI